MCGLRTYMARSTYIHGSEPCAEQFAGQGLSSQNKTCCTTHASPRHSNCPLQLSCQLKWTFPMAHGGTVILCDAQCQISTIHSPACTPHPYILYFTRHLFRQYPNYCRNVLPEVRITDVSTTLVPCTQSSTQPHSNGIERKVKLIVQTKTLLYLIASKTRLILI